MLMALLEADAKREICAMESFARMGEDVIEATASALRASSELDAKTKTFAIRLTAIMAGVKKEFAFAMLTGKDLSVTSESLALVRIISGMRLRIIEEEIDAPMFVSVMGEEPARRLAGVKVKLLVWINDRFNFFFYFNLGTSR